MSLAKDNFSEKISGTYSVIESENGLKIIIDKSEPKGSYIVMFCFMIFFLDYKN